MSKVKLKEEILRIELVDGWTLYEFNRFLESFIYLYDFYLFIETATTYLNFKRSDLSKYNIEYKLKIKKDYVSKFINKNIKNNIDHAEMIENHDQYLFYSYSNYYGRYRIADSLKKDILDSKFKFDRSIEASTITIIPRINKIIINSPGSFDILGFGKVFEVIKDWYTDIKRLKLEKRNQVIDEIKDTQNILKDLGVDSSQIQRIILYKMLNEKIIVGTEITKKIEAMYLVDEEDQGGKKSLI